MIERAFMGGRLSDHDAAVKFRNAPAWFLEPINRDRRQRGVAAIPVRNTATAPARRKPAAARTAPAAAVHRVKPVAKLPAVAFVLTPGVGVIPGGREVFERGAWTDWFRIVQRDRSSREFKIRCLGHAGPVVADLADGSIHFRLIDGCVLVAVWQPDGSKLMHRSLVAQIASGFDAISAEFHPIKATIDRGVRRIEIAGPVGVALLRSNEAPAYAGALCGVLDPAKPSHIAVAELVAKAKARAAGV